LALCALTVFLALTLGALTAVAQSLRCSDAARELARLAARGEPDRGRAVAAQLAPSGASLDLADQGDTVVATVSARLVGSLPITVDGRAVAAAEPGVRSP
ncbi:MAG TPA: TadE family type IV pilus minor pilin, partial [Pseudonocardia sp.]